jgi:hypothetical protein
MHYTSSTAALEDYTAATIDHFDAYTMCQQILESKYKEANTDDITNQQTHLTPEQHADLAKLLSEFPQLFSGKLGLYPHRKVHLEIDPCQARLCVTVLRCAQPSGDILT